MLTLAAPTDRERLQPLLAELPYAQPLRAMFAGTAPGHIWLEDVERPRLALAWDGRHNIYLALRPEETCRSLGIDLCETLHRTLESHVFAVAMLEGRWGYVLHYGPMGLAEPLLKELLRGHEPISDLRRLYSAEGAPHFPAEPPVPGQELAPVDGVFLARKGLEHLSRVAEEVSECWPSRERFLEHGFGLALVQNSRILGWCLAEYVAGGACGLGIEVIAEAQERGHGTLLAHAALQQARSRGLQVYWDCWESNTASQRVAEKVGLRLKRQYPVRFAWYNPLDNASVHLRIALKRGDLTAARGWLQRVLERETTTEIGTARLWPDTDLLSEMALFPELRDILKRV